MTEPIDHYAKAVEMAKLAEDDMYAPSRSEAYTRLGQLHLDLHHGQPQVAVVENDETSDEVYRVVAAWTGMTPDARFAVRRWAEEFYNALGALSTVTVNGQGRPS
jgi:hypothetical protein